MQLNKLFAVLAIGVLVGSAMAQGAGAQGQGQGGRGQGRGGGGFGQRGMMMGGGNQNPSMILLMEGRGPMADTMNALRDDVVADLKLTDEQKTKLAALREKQSQRMQQGGGFGGNGGGGNGGGQRMSEEEREKLRAERQKQQEETTKELNSILTPEQQNRLKQIGVQLAGNRYVFSEEGSKALGVTDAQKTKFEELQRSMQEANRALFQKARDGELTMEEAMEKSQANNKVMDDEVAKLLTADQKAKLAALAGPKFERKSS